MLKTPFLNALAAAAYIILVVSVMNYASRAIPHPQSIIVPVAVVSLFTLSAAVMGYLFLYRPLLLFLDGKKKESVQFFLRTVGVFSVITLIVFILLFTGLVR